jgi:hypothetical protein
MKVLMLWVSVISGFGAAFLWFLATVVTVKYKYASKDTPGFTITATDDRGRVIDVLATANKQTWWNMLAAVATGISMSAQAVSLML